MLLNAEEIQARLDAADELDGEYGGPGGEAFTEAVRSIVPHAEALGDPVLLFKVRVTFAWALRDKPINGDSSNFFGEALPVLHQCLRAWHSEPHLYPEDHVHWMWCQLFLVVDAYVWLYPESADNVHRLLDDLERYCPLTRQGTRYAIDHYRMKLQARKGDLEAVERLWHGLRNYSDPEKHFVMPGRLTHEARMWRRLDRFDWAVETMAPLVAGQIPVPDGATFDDELVVTYLDAGRLDEAAAAHQRSYARPAKKLEEVAAHLEFCARTGNEERGLDVLHRNLRTFMPQVDSLERMWTAAAAALLCLRVMEKDLDREWIWHCECDDPDCIFQSVWSYADLGARLRWEAVDFALKLDELNGTSFQSEKIVQLLHAEPVVEELTLPLDTSEPHHRATPPPAPHLPDEAARDLHESFGQACDIDGKYTRVRRMQALLQSAISADERDLALDIRFTLLDEFVARQDLTCRTDLFTTLVELARLHNDRPTYLGTDRVERLWRAVPAALDGVLTLPSVHAAQVTSLLQTLEPHVRSGTEDLHHLRWFNVELQARRGDVDTARTAWKAFSELPLTSTYTTRENILRRTTWWLDLDCDNEAIEAMTPLVAAGDEREDYLLIPYLRSGRTGEARELHSRTYRNARGPRELAAHLEFCVRTDDLDRGKEIIQRDLDPFCLGYDDSECSIDRIGAVGAAVRMSERIVAANQDHAWTWTDSCCRPEEGWSYARFVEECHAGNILFVTRWDELMARS